MEVPNDLSALDEVELPWFKFEARFAAISREDAISLMDDVMSALCRGHGHGKDHECRFAAFILGPSQMSEHDIECGCDDEYGPECEW